MVDTLEGTTLPPVFDVNAEPPVRKGMALLPQPEPLARGLVINSSSYSMALQMEALGPQIKSIGDSILAAFKALGVPPKAYSYASMSFMPDTASYGLIQWPGLNPDALRKVARENLLPRVIINQRILDTRRYSVFAKQPWNTGWHITMREPTMKPTAQDKKDIQEATNFVMNCARDGSGEYGIDPIERDAHNLAPFQQFLAASVEDLMTVDGWSIWLDKARNGKVNGFAALPAGNIRLANPSTGYRNNRNLFAALLDETGNPVHAFTRDEMVWNVMYPRSDPGAWGYGFPIIEQAVRVIQAFQSGIDLNASTFDKSGIPNAILKLKGEFFNQDQIDAMMREWNNMKKGISKVWGLPVIAVPEDGDIELLDLNDIKGQDIRYKDHLNLMTGVFCLIAGFPIRRLGFFTSGNTRDNMPVPDQSVETQGVDDPGLPPLLSFVEQVLNPYVIQVNWPRLAFGFMAKDPKADARGYEAKNLARTWGESREDTDQEPLETLANGEDMEWLKPLMQIMSLAPQDPAKLSVFGSLAAVLLQKEIGEEQIDEGYAPDPTEPMPGALPGQAGGAGGKKIGQPMITPKKDPAQSQAHGHRAGVRRHGPTQSGKPGTRREDPRTTAGGRSERGRQVTV